MQLCSSASMTQDWCCRVTFAGVLIAFYIVTAIYEAKYLIPQTRGLSICHPDWAWCLAMGGAICWWLTSLVACGEILAFLLSWACSSQTASDSFSWDSQAHSALCLHLVVSLAVHGIRSTHILPHTSIWRLLLWICLAEDSRTHFAGLSICL